MPQLYVWGVFTLTACVSPVAVHSTDCSEEVARWQAVKPLHREVGRSSGGATAMVSLSHAQPGAATVDDSVHILQPNPASIHSYRGAVLSGPTASATSAGVDEQAASDTKASAQQERVEGSYSVVDLRRAFYPQSMGGLSDATSHGMWGASAMGGSQSAPHEAMSLAALPTRSEIAVTLPAAGACRHLKRCHIA